MYTTCPRNSTFREEEGGGGSDIPHKEKSGLYIYLANFYKGKVQDLLISGKLVNGMHCLNIRDLKSGNPLKL